MVFLAIAALLYNRLEHEVSVWLLLVSLGFIGLSLLAAIVSYPRIHRQTGLLVFHLALLGLITLAAFGRLTHMQGHFEIVEGQAFDPGLLAGVKKGLWHKEPMDSVKFIQGPVAVEYEPGIKRGKTFSNVYVANDRGANPTARTVGDDIPLLIDGYRIYSTFRKGFAPILTWESGGLTQTGAVHMPSFPLYLYQQENDWMPPVDGAQPIKMSLDLQTAMDDQLAWTLDSESSRADLLIHLEGQIVHRLREGESLGIEGGSLRYERLAMWKGYNVYYDSMISWMFMVAVFGVAALAWHWWTKRGVQRREEQTRVVRPNPKNTLQTLSA